MKVQVEISPYTQGRGDTHRVEVLAKVEKDGDPVVKIMTATASRFGADGVERPISVCLQEAFADILKQALG